MDNTAA